MKRYRKSVLVSCIIAGLLCGCTQSNKSTEEENALLPVLKIGIDSNYEPYSYVDENGNYAGLDIELAKEACSRMGREPVFDAIKWDNTDACLEDGSIDCIWSCFSMNGREDLYDWAGPYMYSRQVVAVGVDSEIQSLKDLTGKRVAVMSSTKPESIFLEPDNDEIPDVKEVYCLENMNLVFSALQSGYVDATAGHEIVMRQYMSTTPGSYRLLEEDLLSAEVGVAFEKGKDTDVREKLQQIIEEMREDGTLGKILEKYGVGAEENDGGSAQ
jgi:polar amino acid transport system substrate-binding protein